MQGLAEPGPPLGRTGETKWAFLGGWSSFCQSGCVSFGDMLGLNIGRGVVTVVSAHPTRWCVSFRGVVPAGLGKGVGDCRDATVTLKGVSCDSLGENPGEGGNYAHFGGCAF